MTRLEDLPGTPNEEVQALLDLQLNYQSAQVRPDDDPCGNQAGINESSYLDISKDDQQPSPDRIAVPKLAPGGQAVNEPKQGGTAQLGLKLLLNKRGEKVVKMHLDDGRTLFVNLKKLTQHKAQLVDTQQSSSHTSSH